MSGNITKCLLARQTVPGLESLVEINEARSFLLSLEELFPVTPANATAF